MNIEQKLVSSVIGGLKALYGQDVPAAQVQLQKTKKEFEGHLTLVVFPFLRMSKKGPEQTAQEIGEYLQANEPSVAAFNVIKGFLNLTIASSAWIELLNGIHADKQYGIVAVTDNSPLVMIEYSSPNTNKPLHLGHVRNNLLGNALANIVAANGNKVVKTNIVNDRGIHICKSIGKGQTFCQRSKRCINQVNQIMMKRFLFLTIACLFSICGMAQIAADTYVEVLYFHGKQRCVTCKAIEKYTKEVVNADLAELVKNGKLRFKEVDISTPEGEKLAEKYRVSWSSLYVNKWKNGKEERNDMTRFGFQNARNNTSAFKKELKQKINQLLKSIQFYGILANMVG